MPNVRGMYMNAIQQFINHAQNIFFAVCGPTFTKLSTYVQYGNDRSVQRRSPINILFQSRSSREVVRNRAENSTFLDRQISMGRDLTQFYKFGSFPSSMWRSLVTIAKRPPRLAEKKKETSKHPNQQQNTMGGGRP